MLSPFSVQTFDVVLTTGAPGLAPLLARCLSTDLRGPGADGARVAGSLAFSEPNKATPCLTLTRTCVTLSVRGGAAATTLFDVVAVVAVDLADVPPPRDGAGLDRSPTFGGGGGFRPAAGRRLLARTSSSAGGGARARPQRVPLRRRGFVRHVQRHMGRVRRAADRRRHRRLRRVRRPPVGGAGGQGSTVIILDGRMTRHRRRGRALSGARDSIGGGDAGHGSDEGGAQPGGWWSAGAWRASATLFAAGSARRGSPAWRRRRTRAAWRATAPAVAATTPGSRARAATWVLPRRRLLL